MRSHVSLAAATAAAWLIGFACLSGCLGSDQRDGRLADVGSAAAAIQAGTPLTVRLASGVSSETARVGDPWTGSVVTTVTIGSREAIRAGSPVHGVVTAVHVAERGPRAILDSAVVGIDIEGEPVDVKAITEPVVAGTPRALGDGARVAGMATPPKGDAVVLEPGALMTFTVSEPFVPRRG